MVISYNWLKQYLPELTLDVHETGKILTDIGLEVESIEDFESVKGGLANLVIGLVVEKEKHPDADRLSVTKVQVDNSGQLHQIVCGAPNVEKGQKVIVALPGTIIYPLEGESFKIKLSKIRGVESAGMICAEDEIGLGKSHDGILVLPSDVEIGTLAAKYFNVSADKVIHIGLTPNRVDASSHIGVARDLRAALIQRNKINLKLELPAFAQLNKASSATVKVSVDSTDDCKKYFALEIDQVKVGNSPEWLKLRLESIGIRSINNIVDITNFVMHESGQPLHAFDANKIAGKQIIVRRAKEGETFVTLEGTERKLKVSDLVIADEQKPMCLAGVFGGLDSGVSDNTTSIVLESAWFNPVVVRKTARRHELHTDSSFRFERGVDPQMTLWAMNRAAQLIVEIAGGKINGGYVSVETDFEQPIIHFDLAKLNAFTGQEIPSNEVENILTNLDFSIIAKNNSVWELRSPLYRVDVTRPVDVYEEILRIYGYNNIHIPSKVNATPQLPLKDDTEKLVESLSQFLTDKGLNEIMNNSLVSKKANELNSVEGHSSVELLNPLSSELDVMRNSLVYGGLQSIAYNINRQTNTLAFFEIGSSYSKTGEKYLEEKEIGIWLTGKNNLTAWNETAANVDYYSLKGICESVLNRFVKTKFNTAFGFEHNYLLDGFSYGIHQGQVVLGGAVNPLVLKHFDISQPVYFAKINLQNLNEAIKKTKFKYAEVSKFPVIKRDLSLLMDASVKFETLQDLVLAIDKKQIKAVDVFDVYIGKNLEPGKKSYAISLTISNEEKTLKDDEIDSLMQKVIKNISEKTGAVLR